MLTFYSQYVSGLLDSNYPMNLESCRKVSGYATFLNDSFIIMMSGMHVIAVLSKTEEEMNYSMQYV